MSTKESLLLEEIADSLAASSAPQVDLSPLLAAVRALQMPTAEEIAVALVSRLHFPEAPDNTSVYERLIEGVEKLGNRPIVVGGGGGPSKVTIKNDASKPVPVSIQSGSAGGSDTVEVSNLPALQDGGMKVYVVNQSEDVLTGSTTGPASYSTGGFTIDLTDNFSTVEFLSLAVTTVGANLPPCHYEYTLDSPDPGKVKVKVMRHRYDRATATATGTTLSSLPSGVSSRGTSGGIAASVDAIGGSGQAKSANELYTHAHDITVTQTQTNAASVEIANGTDLSGTTWRWLAKGA